LYELNGGHYGSQPFGSVIFDAEGNLYGTTAQGGAHGWGVAYKLIPNKGRYWKEQILHQFTGDNDGGMLYGGLTFDQSGNLYGTTFEGGARTWGVVFQLQPPVTTGGRWIEKV
jgi:uncharacterized repeat protein (TIGR03803 family)